MTPPPDAAHALYEAAKPRRKASAGLLVLGTVLLLCMVVAAVARLSQDDAGAAAGGGPRATVTEPDAAVPAPQTEEGAVNAAVNFLQAYGSPAMYHPEQRRRIINDITSSAVREQVQRQVDEAFSLAATNLGLDEQGQSAGGVLVARTIPVGTRTLAYTEDRAVISVWTTGLLGVAGLTSRLPVQESWSTETVTLEWTPEGWRWVSLEHADGPAPIGSPQVPADADVIAEAARVFAEVSRAR